MLIAVRQPCRFELLVVLDRVPAIECLSAADHWRSARVDVLLAASFTGSVSAAIVGAVGLPDVVRVGQTPKGAPMGGRLLGTAVVLLRLVHGLRHLLGRSGEVGARPRRWCIASRSGPTPSVGGACCQTSPAFLAPHCARMATSSVQRRASTADAFRTSRDGRWPVGVDACASRVQVSGDGSDFWACSLSCANSARRPRAPRTIALGQHFRSLTACRQAPGRRRGYGSCPPETG